MNFFLAGAPQRCFRFQFASYTLFPVSVLPFLLLFLLAAVLALQATSAFVVVLEKLCIEMLATELGTTIVASVLSYILSMVASLSASFAH